MLFSGAVFFDGHGCGIHRRGMAEAATDPPPAIDDRRTARLIVFVIDSFQTLRTVELRQIAIEGAQGQMARFACDLKHQAIGKF